MKRLYYLTDDLDVTHAVADELHAAGISDWHFHVLSQDEQGLFQRHLHSTSVLQRCDLLHLAEQGALIGGLFGLALATTLLLANPAGFPMSWQMFVLILAATTLFATWVGAMAGLSHHHYKLGRFIPQVEAGRHLLMIDIRRRQEPAVRRLLGEHPQLQAAGEDSTWVNPLKPASPYLPMH